jgi:hypothetical protein
MNTRTGNSGRRRARKPAFSHPSGHCSEEGEQFAQSPKDSLSADGLPILRKNDPQEQI